MRGNPAFYLTHCMNRKRDLFDKKVAHAMPFVVISIGNGLKLCTKHELNLSQEHPCVFVRTLHSCQLHSSAAVGNLRLLRHKP